MKRLIVATQSLKDIRCFNRLSTHYVIEWVQTIHELQSTLLPSTPAAVLISIDNPVAQAELVDVVRNLRASNRNLPICLTSNQNDADPEHISYLIELIQAGATDFLELPCVKEEVDLILDRFEPPPETVTDPVVRSVTNPHPLVLLIDDNWDHSQHILNLLPYGFTGFYAPTVHVGLDIVQNKPIDIILLDIALPDLLGNHAISLFQTFSPTSNIIMISAYRSLELVVETIRAGACDYLPKPIRARHLSNRLTYHIKKKLEGERQ